ncbi:hypothetical protein [Thiorhodovibrio litoralis]|uniref:hypothetical protein n=1 Tax=Thiorhodovibrio litoralis TaxID=2952932 RepID=UPI002B25893E|nr:hypothetical protein [Thiorhodovibrio litoralis]WPL11573.1 hypothetical protein Thiosp_01322 [Thiorhodovibrio litoralis]
MNALEAQGINQGKTRITLRALFHHSDQPELRVAADSYVAKWPNCPTGWTILAKACERDW